MRPGNHFALATLLAAALLASGASAQQPAPSSTTPATTPSATTPADSTTTAPAATAPAATQPASQAGTPAASTQPAAAPTQPSATSSDRPAFGVPNDASAKTGRRQAGHRIRHLQQAAGRQDRRHRQDRCSSLARRGPRPAHQEGQRGRRGRHWHAQHRRARPGQLVLHQLGDLGWQAVLHGDREVRPPHHRPGGGGVRQPRRPEHREELRLQGAVHHQGDRLGRDQRHGAAGRVLLCQLRADPGRRRGGRAGRRHGPRDRPRLRPPRRARDDHAPTTRRSVPSR